LTVVAANVKPVRAPAVVARIDGACSNAAECNTWSPCAMLLWVMSSLEHASIGKRILFVKNNGSEFILLRARRGSCNDFQVDVGDVDGQRETSRSNRGIECHG